MTCADVQTIQAGNGTKTQFSFDFPYIFKSEIQVSFWNVTTKEWDVIAQTDPVYPWQVTDANPTIVEFTSTAPPAPATPSTPTEASVDNIRIRRVTQIDDIRAIFNPGSAIRSDDLNKNFEQLRYAIQEANCQGVPDEVYQYLLDYFWSKFDNTAYSGETWVSDDSTLSTTGRIDERFSELKTSGYWDDRYYTETELNNGQLDTRYYTESELNAGQLDNRYYTETELTNGALDGRYYTETELNNGQLDTRYYTETELNAGQLDNRYYTETELDNGQLDNRYYTETEADTKYWNKTTETIASNESWVSNDTTVPTTAAINNRLIDLINDVGAYVVVNSEVTFPNTGIVDGAGTPDAGVLVAVTDATGLTWNGSGVSTNATTSNSTAVTITGITGTSPISNCGAQVLSTSTLHTYTFVRWVVGSNVAQTISDNINEILLVDSNAAAAAASEVAAAASESAAASSASAAASSASAASTSASNAATSASNAATSAASAANSVTAINNLGYYLNWGLITDAVGTTSDYGALV